MPPEKTGKDAGLGEDDSKDAGATAQLSADTADTDAESGKTDQQVWNELDAEEGAAAADDEATAAAASKDDNADGKHEDAAAADAAGAADDQADAAAAKPNQDAKSAKDAAKDTKGQAAKEPTVEELKADHARLVAENERLAQADRSNRGRVSALQRQIDSGQQGKGKAAAPAKKKPFQDAKGKDFAKEYPEVAEPVARELEEVRGELDELKAERTKRETDARTAFLLDNEKVLDKAHPGWDKQAATKDFGNWLSQQPQYVQAAVKSMANAIVDAPAAVDIFDRFEAFRSSQKGGQQGAQQQGKGKPAAQDGPGGGNADGKNGSGLADKRALQLESSSGTRSSGPGLVDGIPEDGDPEAMWKAMDRADERQERQERRQRA